MRICLIEFVKTGGMLHYISQMANALSEQEDITVHVILPTGADTNLFNENIQIKMVPSIGRLLLRTDILLRSILNVDPDVIHITSNCHPLSIPLFPIFKILRKPLFLTIHDVEPHIGEERLIIEAFKWVSIKFSNVLFVHDTKSKTKLIKRRVAESKLYVIPHGDYSFFTNYDINIRGPDKDTILFFGRIQKYKGLEYLIKAEPEISKKFPNLKIIIAGEGDFSEYDEMLVNKDRYEIINDYIPESAVPDLFTRATLVVLPYIEASQTGVIPIAYAFKRPVVATDVGALSDVIENRVTGIIVPPKDIESLSKAIVDLLENTSLAEKMGIEGNRKMTTEMSWEGISKRLIEIYTHSADLSG